MSKPPATRPSITVLATVAYKGETRAHGNRYYFDGILEPTNAEFQQLWDAFKDYQLGTLPASEQVTSVIGKHPGSEVPVWTISPAAPGTLVETGMDRCPGDCAAYIRFTTDQRSAKNHPIYLGNFIKPVYKAPGGPPDDIVTHDFSQIASLAANWLEGFTIGSTLCQRCGPYGAVAQSYVVKPHITHRDFRN